MLKEIFKYRYLIFLMLLMITSGDAKEPSSFLEKMFTNAFEKNSGTINKSVPQTQAQLKFSFAGVVKGAKPAVVSISALQVTERRLQDSLFNDPFFQFFFNNNELNNTPQQQIEKSLGSGVIIDPEGIIITCYHVIRNADTIQVKLDDNRFFEAQVIVKDVKRDLAVLKIKIPAGHEKTSFPFLLLGDSKALEIGDLVLAIGNPFGIGMTVTNGIVSALSRSFNGQILMQTDAAVNPGNSGGALVDMNGHLIGIPNAILSQTGASHGVGFAIPAIVIHPLLKAAKGDGKVVYPWDGLQLKSMTSDEAESFGFLKPTGVLVTTVHSESPAAKAGLKSGDIIIKVNDQALQTLEDYHVAIQGCQINDILHLTIFRKGTEAAITFPLIAPPANSDAAIYTLQVPEPFKGVKVANMSPALAMNYNLVEVNREGVVVIETPRGLLRGGFSGLQPGDIIESINGEKINSVKQLSLKMTNALHQMTIRRGGAILLIQVG